MVSSTRYLLALIVGAVAATAVSGSDDAIAKQAMPLSIADALGHESNVMALQATDLTGGSFEPHLGKQAHIERHFHLRLNDADNMTAVIRDPLKAGLGIEMVPHAAMKAALPAFAVILANLTGTAAIERESFQVLAVMIKALDIAPNGEMTYKVEILDSDIARGANPSALIPGGTVPASKQLPVAVTDLASPDLATVDASPKREVPESFKQATVLIDLVGAHDETSNPISIRHMAETGELARNINKFITTAPEDAVNPQGVLTIGWMLPWSLWAWICCPTFFILTPWAIPLWVFCCI